MGDWEFLHEMEELGYSPEEIDEASGSGLAPWELKYLDAEWLEAELKDKPKDDSFYTDFSDSLVGKNQSSFSLLEQTEILENLIECAKRHFENTGRYLQLWGEIGEIYAEVKLGLKRHATRTAGSDGIIEGKLVEVKTISPEKKNKQVQVKSQGNFEQLLIISIDSEFRFKSTLIDRGDIKETSGKFLRARFN
jgi:hypothetical protein